MINNLNNAIDEFNEKIQENEDMISKRKEGYDKKEAQKSNQRIDNKWENALNDR